MRRGAGVPHTGQPVGLCASIADLMCLQLLGGRQVESHHAALPAERVATTSCPSASRFARAGRLRQSLSRNVVRPRGSHLVTYRNLIRPVTHGVAKYSWWTSRSPDFLNSRVSSARVTR